LWGSRQIRSLLKARGVALGKETYSGTVESFMLDHIYERGVSLITVTPMLNDIAPCVTLNFGKSYVQFGSACKINSVSDRSDRKIYAGC
jgi:hypothetical protein